MHTPYEVPGGMPAARGQRPPLRRPVRGRVVGGVCAGVAEHLGLPVNPVRVGFLVASLAGGAGLLVYVFLWILTPEGLQGSQPSDGFPVVPVSSRDGARGVTPSPDGGPGPWRRPDDEPLRNLVIGAALVLLGAGLLLQQRGVNLRLGLLIPLLAIGVGAVLAWSRLDEAERGRWLVGGVDRRAGLVRLGIGIALASVGLIVLVTQGRGLAGLWDVGVAAVAVLAGAAFICAPWVVRLWNDLRAEQTERIRATEKADIAAHLHDSVLQTLALIQRRADDPAAVSRLARAQERELRSWLYAGPPGSSSTLASAVTEVAHEVEDLHGVPIGLVVTGDRALGEHDAALVRALREALLNAVRHGAAPVSAYVEVGPELVEAFVRDHGPGFEVAAVPADRLGVRESIMGRMSRHGGSGGLRRLDDGMEVALSLPVTAPEPVALSGSPPHEPEQAGQSGSPPSPPGAAG